MKPVGLFPEDPQHFGAFRGADDMVTELRQPLFIELNDHVLVIDEEDAFVPPLFFLREALPRQWSPVFLSPANRWKKVSLSQARIGETMHGPILRLTFNV